MLRASKSLSDSLGIWSPAGRIHRPAPRGFRRSPDRGLRPVFRLPMASSRILDRHILVQGRPCPVHVCLSLGILGRWPLGSRPAARWEEHEIMASMSRNLTACFRPITRFYSLPGSSNGGRPRIERVENADAGCQYGMECTLLS